MIWFDSPLLMGAAFLLLIFGQSSLDWLNLFFWFIGLASCFPFDGVRSWWNLVHLVFDASFLSFARYVALLRVLPLCLGIVVGVIALLLACSLIFDGSCGFILSSLQAVFIAILLVVAGMLCLKVKVEACLVQDLAHPFSCMDSTFSRIIDKLRQTFSFGSRSFCKQDLEPIYKPSDWITYFNRKANNQDRSRLHPAKITLDKLVDKLELALSQAATTPPKLFVEQVRDPIVGPFPYITGDIDQIIYLLVQAVLRVSGKLDVLSPPAVRVQLHNTFLQFKQKDVLDGSYPACMLFQATALVISNAMVDADLLPKIKNIYDNFMDTIVPQRADLAPPFIDLQQETIASIIAAHYGYLEYPADNKEPTMLLVLPIDVIDIMNNITFKVPITLETPLTHKEQTDAMAALMQFYDHVRQCACGIDPIDLDTISQLLVLLQQHFSFKRHASGQLFYVRAVGIAKLVLEWVFYAPKVVYASLLYGLVCHVQLPLSYVKDHYNLGVYTIVLSLLGLTKRQDLDHPSLVYVENRLEKAIKEDQVHLAVLCIKLAERLYDLGHAAGYTDLAELRHMAQETLAIDIKLADEYLDPEIARALRKNAKQALKACKDKDKKESKDKDKDS